MLQVTSTAESLVRQILLVAGEVGADLIYAYFDESAENNTKNGILAVCGYALDAAGVDGLVPEWQRLTERYRVPFFHMTECNANNGVFSHLSPAECDLAAREAIRLARTYPLHGHAMVLDQPVYREILQNEGFDCDPYTFMVWGQFIHVNRWVHENRPDEKISLFFESGYRSEPRANELLRAISPDHWGGKNHVTSHTFVRKEESEPTQAADLIAWHVRKAFENDRSGKAIRKDTQALIRDRKVLTIDWTVERLEKLRDDFIQSSGTLEQAAKTIFAPAR